MPNITYLECRLKGHQDACEETATILPEGGGLLDHAHTCLRCGRVHNFETEELPPEVDQMLRMTVQPSMHRIAIDLAGTTRHKQVH